MSEELKAAQARITYLEGEIAKRDARIVELESRYQRDVYGLNNECDPIGGEPAGGYANDNARLRSELAAIKAQDVVMPERELFEEWADEKGFCLDCKFFEDGNNYESEDTRLAFEIWMASARLYAAPAAPAADGWIPVSERLPAVESRLDQECRAGTLSIAPLNVSAAVLVFDGEKVRSKRLDWFDGCLPLPYCITHWMPLPAAPAANSAKGVV